MVLPPSALNSPTTISISPYTTSLEVAVPTTSGGSTVYAVSVTTITLSPPPITTTEIPFSNVEITTDARNGFSFQPTPSIVFPPIGYPITIVSEGTSTVTTRSVTLPPWPFVGAPGDPAETTTNAQNPDPTGEDEPPASTSAAVGPLPVWKTWPPSIITPVTDDIKDIGPVEDITGTAIVFPCNIWFMNVSHMRDPYISLHTTKTVFVLIQLTITAVHRSDSRLESKFAQGCNRTVSAEFSLLLALYPLHAYSIDHADKASEAHHREAP